jgi:hypothetical protein
MGVVLMEDEKRLQLYESDSQIVCSSICDPYVFIVTESGRVIRLEVPFLEQLRLYLCLGISDSAQKARDPREQSQFLPGNRSEFRSHVAGHRRLSVLRASRPRPL